MRGCEVVRMKMVVLLSAIIIIVLTVGIIKWKFVALALFSYLEEKGIEISNSEYKKHMRFVIKKTFGG